MNDIDLVIRAAASVAGILLCVLLARGIRNVYRAARSVTVEGIARTAGKATAAMQGKTTSVASRAAQAFKEGQGR